MKRNVISKFVLSLGIILMLTSVAKTQVFNTAGVLGRGEAAVGFEPSWLIYDSDNEFLMFLHAGVGLGQNIDLGAKLGVFGDENYYGGDIEFGFSRSFSLSAGMHHFHDFGLDGTANITVPLAHGTKLITGLDMDIIFGDDTKIPLWIPIGIQVAVGNGWSLIMESEIEITDKAYHYFGFGMAYGF